MQAGRQQHTTRLGGMVHECHAGMPVRLRAHQPAHHASGSVKPCLGGLASSVTNHCALLGRLVEVIMPLGQGRQPSTSCTT